MKSLYTEDHRYTDEALNIMQEFSDLIRDFFEKHSEEYSPRELSHVLMGQLWEHELNAVLRNK